MELLAILSLQALALTVMARGLQNADKAQAPKEEK